MSIVPYLLLIVAFFLLAKGADYFIDGASRLAEYFRVSSLFIGLTIAAIGTSAPEAAVSINATLTEVGGISLGNVVGSNIANVCVAIGIAACLKPLTFESSTIKKEMPFMLVITALMLIFSLDFANTNTSVITQVEGLIFLALFVVYLFYLSRMAINDRKISITKAGNKKPSIIRSILLTLLGVAGIILGGDLAVDNAVKVAEFWGVSDKVIGISIVASGTSVPEIVTTIVAVVKGKVPIAIGNIVGSNIFNILLVLGITATVRPVRLPSDVVFDGAICLAVSALFFLLSKVSKQFYRVQGLSFLIIYILYISLLFIRG